MHARLRWRVLLVPRLALAVGVIFWALLNVLLSGLLARRRPRPCRLPPTGEDPVGAALAGARPLPRFPGEQLDVEDLRWIVSVDDLEDAGDGYDTLVGLDDTVSSYADMATDGLADALADQPGIDAVHHADREVLLVRSALALRDVHAATVRALLSINRAPRGLPRLRSLEPAVQNAVADAVATAMAEHGFAGRLRVGHENAGAGTDPPPGSGPGFYRFCAADGLVQVVRLEDAVGQHQDDGTIVAAHVRLTVEVVEIGTAGVTGSIVFRDGREVVAGERILAASSDPVPATVEGIGGVLVSWAVPLCRATTSRAAIVDRWVGWLPWSVPDRLPWEAADVAARWGFRQHARDLLRHVRKRPQAMAVAARHGL